MNLATVIPHDEEKTYYFREGCWINELSNRPGDPDLSIARATVAPGVTTKSHRLLTRCERYVIISGRGHVTIDEQQWDVGLWDVVHIPPGSVQSIHNPGPEDLVFLAMCTPRFDEGDYRDEASCAP